MLKGAGIASLFLVIGLVVGWNFHQVWIDKQAEMFFKGVDSTKKK